MITAPYSNILEALCDDMGYERASDGNHNLTSEQWHAAKRAVSLAIGNIWPMAFWRDLLDAEERWFAPDYSPTESVVAGDVRFHRAANNYYLCLKGTPATSPANLVGVTWENIEGDWTEASTQYEVENWWDSAAVYVVGDRVKHTITGTAYQCIQAHANQEPPAAAYWGELIDWVPTIDRYQTGQTQIGRVEGVYTVNPKVYKGAKRIAFVEQGRTIQIRSLDRHSVWVNFCPPTPRLVGDRWSSSAFYSPQSIDGTIPPPDSFTLLCVDDNSSHEIKCRKFNTQSGTVVYSIEINQEVSGTNAVSSVTLTANDFTNHDLQLVLHQGKYAVDVVQSLSFKLGAANKLLRCTDDNSTRALIVVKESGYYTWTFV